MSRSLGNDGFKDNTSDEVTNGDGSSKGDLFCGPRIGTAN
jgi:hypothetical protein